MLQRDRIDLELVELSEGLGKYFGADSGVLVVSAPQDDALQLEDVAGFEHRLDLDVARLGRAAVCTRGLGQGGPRSPGSGAVAPT